MLYVFCWLALMLSPSWSTASANEELYLLGAKAYQDGLWDLAIQQLGQYLSLYPEGEAAAQARFVQAEALFQKGQYRPAATIYQEFSRLYPQSESLDKVYYRLGVSNYRLGDYAAAEEAYKRLLEDFPHSPLGDKARLGLAESLYAQGKYGLAKDAYQQIAQQLHLHPNSELALYGLGWSSLKLGDYNQAVASFQQLIIEFPDNPVYSEAQLPLAQAYYRQGESLYKQGQYRLALDSYQRLLRDYPQSKLAPTATYNLGLCYLGLNQSSKGEGVFKQLISEYPKHELGRAAWLQLGGLRFKRGEYAKAAQAYKEATQSPDLQIAAESRYWLGECLAHQGQLDRALAEFLKLSQQDATETQWLNLARYQAGQIYSQQQKTLAAKKLFLVVAQRATDAQLGQMAKERLRELLNVTVSE